MLVKIKLYLLCHQQGGLCQRFIARYTATGKRHLLAGKGRAETRLINKTWTLPVQHRHCLSVFAEWFGNTGQRSLRAFDRVSHVHWHILLQSQWKALAVTGKLVESRFKRKKKRLKKKKSVSSSRLKTVRKISRNLKTSQKSS